MPVRVLNFAKSVDMNLRTRMFQAWQSSILRQNKVLLLSIIMKWQQFILGNKLEKLRQSSRYADLLRRIHEYLKKCQLDRLPLAARMCLLRRKRLFQHKEPTEHSSAEDDVTSDDQASSAESNAEEHGNQNRSSKLLICDMDRLPPIAN